jgi:hypothetical protein
MDDRLNNKVDSPIESILYCEFHTTAGPMIVYQMPQSYVTKEQFDSISNYLIPKPELERRLQTVNALGLKVIGYPIGIDNARYPRNRLIFNVCFVCRPHMRTFHYEPLVKKLNKYFEELELECQFLTSLTSRPKIPSILEDIRVKLNEFKACILEMTSSTTINLKIVKVHPDPEEVLDEQVPVLLIARNLLRPSRWDLTTQQILPYIDGFKHILRIAIEADVEVSLVKACIQNLIYYGIVKLIPIFQYSNSYLPTQRLVELYENEELQQECIRYVSRPGSCDNSPSFRSIFKIFCNMNYGITIRDLCLQFNPSSLNIDEKRLIRFGLMKGLIRRIHRYPILMEDGEPSDANISSTISCINTNLFDGDHNYDQICCKVAKQNLSVKELNDDVERRDDILLIHK